MTDRLFIRHPDHPERNGYVSRTAFDALWSKKGYVADEVTPTEDDLNAELDRRAGIEPPTNQVVPDPPESPDEEKARLTTQLEAANVQVDRRWGLKRLRTEVAGLTEDQTCSVCGANAVYEIKDAPSEKGNLACEEHRRMWPLSDARPLAGVGQ